MSALARRKQPPRLLERDDFRVQPHRPDVQKALDNMNPDFIACRDFNHAWHNFGAKWYKSSAFYEQILKCTRCGCQRFRRFTRSGRPLESWYEYPAGYLMPPGVGRLSSSDRDMIRLANLTGPTLRVVTSDE